LDLIQRCRTGGEEAFAELFHQHKNLVYKTAFLLLGDTTAAEDALQEVFVKVYCSLDTFDPSKGAFTTWLRRITVNHCLNVRRRGRPSISSLEDLAVGESSPAESRRPSLPEEWTVDREKAEAIWRAVQDLSPPLRATVVLRYYEELSYREISRVLDVPLGTVKWRLHEALKTLRQALGGSVEGRVPGRSIEKKRRPSYEV